MSDITTENELLIKKVKTLEDEIKKLQEAINESKQLIDLDATKAPIKLYIVGKYKSFDKEKGELSILVEGNVNYYPLEYYGSKRLPFPDSRVLIFNIEDNNNRPYILAFNGGRLIEPSQKYVATILSINYIHNSLLVNTVEYGNIRLTTSANFLEKVKIKTDMQLNIKKIQVATEIYFVPDIDENNICLDSTKMYTFLSELA
jgi:hypothetical protein